MPQDMSWNEWLHHNIERDCAPDDLTAELIKNGFSKEQADDQLQRAISQVRHNQLKAKQAHTNSVNNQSVFLPNALRIESDAVEMYGVDDFLSANERIQLIELIRANRRKSTTVEDGESSFGPAGGDPDAFEELTGIDSSWSDNGEQSNSSIPATLPPIEPGIPAIPQSGGVAAFLTDTAIGRLFSRLFGFNPVTVAAQAIAPTALGGNRETYPIDNPRGLDVEFSYHPSELSATVRVNGQPTDVRVEPVYSSNGEIESFRPVTAADSDRLEQLTGATIMSSEEADEADTTTGGVNGAESTSEIEHDAQFPPNPDQTKHILGDREGYIPDTPENRQTIIDSVTEENYRDTDEFGNQRHYEENDDGTQTWVQVRDGVIQNAGVNTEGNHR